jgi:hypothetical protein
LADDSPIETYSISLPNGWGVINHNLIDAFNENLKKSNPKKITPKFNCGFQESASSTNIDLPFILISENHAGRLPYPSFSQSLQYDQSTNIMWIYEDINHPEYGLIKGISGLIPIETGYVQIFAYSSLSRFDTTYSPMFRQIISSVVISPSLIYKPQWSENPLLKTILSRKGLALTIGVIIFIIVSIIKTRKKMTKTIAPERKERRRRTIDKKEDTPK